MSRISYRLMALTWLTLAAASSAAEGPQMWGGVRMNMKVEPAKSFYMTTLPPNVQKRYHQFSERAELVRHVEAQPEAIRGNGLWFTRNFMGRKERETLDQELAAIAEALRPARVPVFACDSESTQGTSLVTWTCVPSAGANAAKVRCEPQVTPDGGVGSTLLGYICVRP